MNSLYVNFTSFLRTHERKLNIEPLYIEFYLILINGLLNEKNTNPFVTRDAHLYTWAGSQVHLGWATGRGIRREFPVATRCAWQVDQKCSSGRPRKQGIFLYATIL